MRAHRMYKQKRYSIYVAFLYIQSIEMTSYDSSLYASTAFVIHGALNKIAESDYQDVSVGRQAGMTLYISAIYNISCMQRKCQ